MRETTFNRLDAQLSKEERLKYSDVVLSKNESEEVLLVQIDAL